LLANHNPPALFQIVTPIVSVEPGSPLSVIVNESEFALPMFAVPLSVLRGAERVAHFGTYREMPPTESLTSVPRHPILP
jgi:hypothetical protein